MTAGEVCRDQFLPAKSESDYNESGRSTLSILLKGYKKRSENKLVNVLDYGCGDGRVARFLAKECENLTCVDVSPHVLELVEKRVKTYGNNNVNFILADEFNEENKYDLIGCFQVIQHNPFDQQMEIVSKIKNALNDSGLACLHLPKLECHPEFEPCETCMRFTKDQVSFIGSNFSKFELDDITLNNENEDYFLWVQK
jgi:cyclopropane fatty-acyl-phospholipid synthase-like methyltransferase